MRITAQDFHALYAPSECDLRVYLRAKHEPEAEPSEYEQVLFRLGQRHEAAHLATFPQVVDLRKLSFEQRIEETKAQMAGGAAVLYQPALKFSGELDGVACDFVGEPDFLIREGGGYFVRDVKLVRHVDKDLHPEVILQLQFYGWLYTQVFGVAPLWLEGFSGQGEVVTVPNAGAGVLDHMRGILKLKTLTEAPYQPVGWSKCTGCGFHDRCWVEAKRTNDVAMVLGVDQGLAVELHRQGIRQLRS